MIWQLLAGIANDTDANKLPICKFRDQAAQFEATGSLIIGTRPFLTSAIEKIPREYARLGLLKSEQTM